MTAAAGQALAAVQTPPGRGGIAVILVTGPQAQAVVDAVFQPLPSHRLSRPGGLQLGRIADKRGPIDEAIICRRGEVVEVNIHGGPAAVRAAVQALEEAGATIAPAQGAAANFNPAHPRWNNPAIGMEMLAAIGEATGPVALEAISHQWSAGISALACSQTPGQAALAAAADALPLMQRLLAPPEVVIAGPPNAGKSTLANALLGRPASIAHETAGTTRDWVREAALIDGIAVWITDTAGIFPDPRGLDAQAVARARHRLEEADLVLLLGAGSPPMLPGDWHAPQTITVATQIDRFAAWPADVAVSAVSGDGLDELRRGILSAIGLADFDAHRPMAFTERQAELLRRAAGTPRRARAALDELLAGRLS